MGFIQEQIDNKSCTFFRNIFRDCLINNSEFIKINFQDQDLSVIMDLFKDTFRSAISRLIFVNNPSDITGQRNNNF